MTLTITVKNKLMLYTCVKHPVYWYIYVVQRLWRFKYFQDKWKERPGKNSVKTQIFYFMEVNYKLTCCSNFEGNSNSRAISMINHTRREKNPDITEIMVARNTANCLSKGYWYCEIGPCTQMTIWLYQAKRYHC